MPQKQTAREILNKAIITGIEFWRNEAVLPVPVGNITQKALSQLKELMLSGEGSNEMSVSTR